MRFIFTTIATLIILTSVLAQSEFDPKVVILLPKSRGIEIGIEDRIESFEKHIIAAQKQYLNENRDSLLLGLEETPSIPANFKAHYTNQIDFAKELNFINSIAWSYCSSFQSFLGFNFETGLVVVENEGSVDEIESMREFAKTFQADYLLNIDTLFVSKYKKGLVIKPVFTLYDRSEDELFKIDSYEYDELNRQSFKVGKKTLNIYFQDISARSEVFNLIVNKGNKDVRAATSVKINILDSLFTVGKNNRWLKTTFSDIDVPQEHYTSGLVNPDSSRVMGFFITEVSNFQDLAGPGFKLNIVYGKTNSKKEKWSYEFVHENMYIQSEFDKEKTIRNWFLKLEDMYFMENSEIPNDKFWTDEEFLSPFAFL